MNNKKRRYHRVATSLLLPLLALLCLAPAQAQNVRIVAANAAGSDVYDVAFAGSSGSIDIFNTDANAHVSIRSLTFRGNAATGAIDVLAADTSRGTILLYAATGPTAVTVWQPGAGVARPTDGSGPVQPDGLSIDGFGNLYVASSAPGNSTLAELWVFPRNPAGPLPGGFGLPLLVDNDFNGSLIEETAVLRTSGSVAAAGSLLVLTSGPARVIAYSTAALNSVLSGSGEVDGTPLITLPAGISPGGLDVWPADGSLLITTSNGSVLRYAANGSALPAFASGLGNGKFKIRTALENSQPLAVIANNNGGQLIKLDGPMSITATITSGVQRPQGLTVTNAGTGSASTCAATDGCDFIGGVLKHKVAAGSSVVQGTVLEEPCVIQADPRVDVNGVCNGQPLPIANVCPGFGSGVIPGYLCGGSGDTGKGFAIVDTRASFLVPAGSVVTNEAFAENILGDKPVCGPTGSEEVVLWAPSVGEGTIAEGTTALDVTIGCFNPLLGMTRGFSHWAFGLVLDKDSTALSGATEAAKVLSFVAAKYTALLTTLNTASIQSKVKNSLVSCVKNSQRQFSRGLYADAITIIQSCDAQARAAPTAFSASAKNPNPFGEIVGRFANLDYTIGYRLLP